MITLLVTASARANARPDHPDPVLHRQSVELVKAYFGHLEAEEFEEAWSLIHRDVTEGQAMERWLGKASIFGARYSIGVHRRGVFTFSQLGEDGATGVVRIVADLQDGSRGVIAIAHLERDPNDVLKIMFVTPSVLDNLFLERKRR